MPETNPNPSLDRHWLQVNGLPLPPAAAAVRAEFDRIERVDVIPNSSRTVLWGPENELIGALDLQPAAKARVDAIAEGPAVPEPDPSKGDTVIRPLDLDNPEHAAALAGPRFIHDPEREPPPRDLPDIDREHITSIGTAAAFAGNGALATRPSIRGRVVALLFAAFAAGALSAAAIAPLILKLSC